MDKYAGDGVAADYDINRICKAFLKAKRLDLYKGYEHLRNQVLERAGITDPDLIYELENIYTRFQNLEREKELARSGKR